MIQFVKDWWKLGIFLGSLALFASFEPRVGEGIDVPKLVLFDDDFWEPDGCDEGFGPLMLELQPGTLPYQDTLEIRGCVKVIEPEASEEKE